jgi:hypothetical protein
MGSGVPGSMGATFARMGWRVSSLLSCVAGAAVLAAACGDEAPPFIADPGGKDAAADVIFGGEAAPPTCNAGPDLGVCACTELGFLSDVPNLYFVLDRSGSMATDDKWTTVRIVVSQVMESLGPRASFGLTMFPMPSTTEACVAGVQNMSVRPGDSPAGTQGPTTKALLQITSGAPSGGTPTAETLGTLLPTLEALSGRTFVILATDGGPNCDGIATCNADQCIDNIEAFTGCPTGGPPNCCDPSLYGPLDCLDAQPTVDAVAAIAATGIPVYVIGVPGSAPYAALLDRLATAGGTARASEPLYYRVDSSDESALMTALSQIAAKITATCTLTLSEPPPDPSHVNVYFDDVAVPADPVNGWTLDGETITLVGSSCDEVMSGAVLNVRVVAGCPTVQPN